MMCVQPPLGTIFLLATSFTCHILGMRLVANNHTLDLSLVSLQLWMWAWLPWRALDSPCWQECWCSGYSPAELKPSCCPARGSNTHELHFHTGFKKCQFNLRKCDLQLLYFHISVVAIVVNIIRFLVPRLFTYSEIMCHLADIVSLLKCLDIWYTF